MSELVQEVVLHQPNVFKSHLLGEGHLLEGLPKGLRLSVGRPGLGYLQLEKHPEQHASSRHAAGFTDNGPKSSITETGGSGLLAVAVTYGQPITT